jgi:hypothetical protein
MLQCGLFRSNFAFAISRPVLSLPGAVAPRLPVQAVLIELPPGA